MARTETRPGTTAGQARVLHATRPRGAWTAWLAQPAVRAPLGVFVLTRLLFLLLTYFGVILYSARFQSPHPSLLHQLLPAWNRWDTAWYIDIARRGYAWTVPGAQTSPTAFFPLYPLLIRLGTTLTHRSDLTVALAISNLAFLGALAYLWRLTSWELDGSLKPAGRAADRTILYVATFPTALFFFAGYTESLFLFLTVACFYHLRRQDWLLAGLFGALASATRVSGVLLLLPFLYEYARSRNFSVRRLDVGALGALLIPSGLLAFMVYLQRAVGDPLAFSHHQAGWQKIFTLRLWAGLLESLRQILAVQPAASFFEAHNVLNLGLGGAFLVATILVARRLPASYTLYLAAFWLLTLSSPAMADGYPVPLVSLSRYVLSLFPVFMAMGTLGAGREFHDAYLVLSVGLLALLTVQFLHGGWVV
ncbi:MAG: hypothetical protein JOZ41_02755 [Chloroflexi bacterium]|nr:hypothetical protein [Chloroflexota bacterium]